MITRLAGVLGTDVRMLFSTAAESSESPSIIMVDDDKPILVDSLPIDEYYQFSADFAKMYREDGIKAPVMIWQSIYLNGRRNTWTCYPVKAGTGRYRRCEQRRR